MIRKVRRVVTGHDAQGRSIILSDGPATSVKEIPTFPGLALTDLWETGAAPASNAGSADAANRPVRLEPPKNGTVFRVVEFPPDSARPQGGDSRKGFESIGAGHVVATGHADPMMHKTATVDYAVVVKGEIYAVMEKGETLLRAGDVLVQRGTNHSWSVRGKEPALVAFILVSAEPLK
jgi:mannose-6-phosphate isomerase-like protein (cupin superfamily)